MSAHRFHMTLAGLLALALIVGETGRVNATPLDPNDFQAKAMANGAFPNAAGVYKVSTFDVANGLYIQGPGGAMPIPGMFVNGVGVFAFTSINLMNNMSLVTDNSLGAGAMANGSPRPFALLSLGDVSISGIINLNGSSGGMGAIPAPAAGVPGGPSGTGGGDGGTGGSGMTGYRGNGGFGPIGNSFTAGGGGASPSANVLGGGGGGGFGGKGGSGGGNMPGAGGPSFGNLFQMLQGGSGGGGGSGRSAAMGGMANDVAGGGGGGGGGGIEIGALGNITIGGSITAIGGKGGEGGGGGGGGGGSGGGIFLHGNMVALTGSLSVAGGPGGGPGTVGGGGGGGGGGRVLILNPFKGDPANISVRGGEGGGTGDNAGRSGDPGEIVITPEPSTWLLLGSGIVGLAFASRAGKGSRASLMLPPSGPFFYLVGSREEIGGLASVSGKMAAKAATTP